MLVKPHSIAVFSLKVGMTSVTAFVPALIPEIHLRLLAGGVLAVVCAIVALLEVAHVYSPVAELDAFLTDQTEEDDSDADDADSTTTAERVKRKKKLREEKVERLRLSMVPSVLSLQLSVIHIVEEVASILVAREQQLTHDFKKSSNIKEWIPQPERGKLTGSPSPQYSPAGSLAGGDSFWNMSALTRSNSNAPSEQRSGSMAANSLSQSDSRNLSVGSFRMVGGSRHSSMYSSSSSSIRRVSGKCITMLQRLRSSVVEQPMTVVASQPSQNLPAPPSPKDNVLLPPSQQLQHVTEASSVDSPIATGDTIEGPNEGQQELLASPLRRPQAALAQQDKSEV